MISTKKSVGLYQLSLLLVTIVGVFFFMSKTKATVIFSVPTNKATTGNVLVTPQYCNSIWEQSFTPNETFTAYSVKSVSIQNAASVDYQNDTLTMYIGTADNNGRLLAGIDTRTDFNYQWYLINNVWTFGSPITFYQGVQYVFAAQFQIDNCSGSVPNHGAQLARTGWTLNALKNPAERSWISMNGGTTWTEYIHSWPNGVSFQDYQVGQELDFNGALGVLSQPLSINTPIDGSYVASPVLFNGLCTTDGEDLPFSIGTETASTTGELVCANGSWDLPYQDLTNDHWYFHIENSNNTQSADVQFFVIPEGSQLGTTPNTLAIINPVDRGDHLFYNYPNQEAPFRFRYNANRFFRFDLEHSTTTYPTAGVYSEQITFQNFVTLDPFSTGVFDQSIKVTTSTYEFYRAAIINQSGNIVFDLKFRTFGDVDEYRIEQLPPGIPAINFNAPWSCTWFDARPFLNVIIDPCYMFWIVKDSILSPLSATATFTYQVIRGLKPYGYPLQIFDTIKNASSISSAGTSTPPTYSMTYNNTNINLIATSTYNAILPQETWDNMRPYIEIGIYILFLAYLFSLVI